MGRGNPVVSITVKQVDDRSPSQKSTSRKSAVVDTIDPIAPVSVAPPSEKLVVRPRASAARRLVGTRTAPEEAPDEPTVRPRAKSLPARVAPNVLIVPGEKAERDCANADSRSRWSYAISKALKSANGAASGITPLRKRFTAQVRLGFFELVQAAVKKSHVEEAHVEEESAAQRKLRKREEQIMQTHGSHSDPSYLMRYMVLGSGGLEKKGDHQRGTRGKATSAASPADGVLLTSESPQGTPEEIWKAWQAWTSMDQAAGGYVKMYDFFRWVSEMDKSKHSAFLWKAVAGQEARITIEHLLRVLWPRAQRAHLEAMVDHIEQSNTQQLLVVPEPDLMTHEMQSGLAKVFEALDADRDNKISVSELVNAGYMSNEEAVDKVATFAKGGQELSLDQFVEMMCPDGYRYSKDASVALCAEGDGCIIRLNPNNGKWYRATLPSNRFLRSLYPERYSGLAAAGH